MGALDTLLGIPAAIGGGALDILEGDRTNVPAGEQVKRGIEALLLSGDNPANLIAIHQMNARRDAVNQAAVASPDFQRSLQVNQAVHNLSPMEAFAATAKQYGISGYAPDTQMQAVDAAPGGPSLPQQQETPILPPPSTQALVKNVVGRRELNAMTTGDPVDQLLAQYSKAGIPPPADIQKLAADRAVGDAAVPGRTQRTINWRDGKLDVRIQDLKPDEQTFDDPAKAKDAAYGGNLSAQAMGVPYRYVVIESPDGTYGVHQGTDPEAQALGTQQGTSLGKQTAPAPGLKSDVQLERDKAAVKAAQPSPAEREKGATATDLVTRLGNLKTTFLDAQNAKLGGALGPYIEAMTGGQPTGPIANWIKVPLAQYTSLGTDAERKLIREQASIENQYIQAITGAQVSWQEAVRIGRQLPNMNHGPEFFLQGIDTSIDNLKGLEAAKANTRAGVPGLTPQEAKAALAEARSGGEAAAPAETGAGTSATPATTGRSLTLKSGRTITVTD